MPYRDILLTVGVGFLVPFALFRPFVGLLIFSWLAYLRPQELCWSFARDLPFSFVIAGATILGIALGRLFGPPFSPYERFFRVDRRTTLLVLFWAALAVCAILAVHPALARPELTEVSKVFVFALLTTGLCTTRNRLRLLLIVIAGSLGLMALKHGVYAVRTLEFRILRGPGGMMLDNNDFGLALVMGLPLLFYLAITERHLWMKVGALFLAFWTVATAVFTHSRGGFVALGLMTLIWLLKFRRRSWALIVAPLLLLVTAAFLPQDFINRGRSVFEGEPDASVSYRLIAWRKAINMALDHPEFGVGPGNFESLWDRYEPIVDLHAITVHNTYLHLLAETGVLGLGLFLALLVTTIGGLMLLRRRSDPGAAEEWRVNYGHALELSIIGFLFGALFLSRAHFDLTYQLVAMSTALGMAVDRSGDLAGEFVYWRRREEHAIARSSPAV